MFANWFGWGQPAIQPKSSFNDPAQLPPDIVLKIFDFLSFEDKKQCKLVCGYWFHLIDSKGIVTSRSNILYQELVTPKFNGNLFEYASARNRSSNHLFKFIQDGLQNLYGTNMKLKNMTWTAYDDLFFWPIRFIKSNYLLHAMSKINVKNSSIARQITSLELSNCYFRNVTPDSPVQQLIENLPNLKRFAFTESYDFVDKVEGRTPTNTLVKCDPEANWTPEVRTTLANLKEIAIRIGLHESESERTSIGRSRYNISSLLVPKLLDYAARFCSNLKIIEFRNGRHRFHIQRADDEQKTKHYQELFYLLSKTVRKNAATLRTLRISTYNLEDLKTINASISSSNLVDPRTNYEKPKNHDGIPFQILLERMTGLGLNGQNTAAVNGAENVEPTVTSWLDFGLNLKILEIDFHLAELSSIVAEPSVDDSPPVLTQTGRFVEFIRQQSELRQLKIGQLHVAGGERTASEFMTTLANVIAANCSTQITVATQHGIGMTHDEYDTWKDDPLARALAHSHGFINEHCPLPVSVQPQEIIGKDESCVKLKEREGQNGIAWDFAYVTWHNLTNSLLYTRNPSNLTKITIQQGAVPAQLKLVVTNADLQKVIGDCVRLKQLHLEHCNLTNVSDEGLTGLRSQSIDRMKAVQAADVNNANNEPVGIQEDDFNGRPLSSLRNLHSLKLHGLSPLITDITAQHAFVGLKLTSLELSNPNISAHGKTTLQSCLRSGTLVDKFRIQFVEN